MIIGGAYSGDLYLGDQTTIEFKELGVLLHFKHTTFFDLVNSILYATEPTIDILIQYGRRLWTRSHITQLLRRQWTKFIETTGNVNRVLSICGY